MGLVVHRLSHEIRIAIARRPAAMRPVEPDIVSLGPMGELSHDQWSLSVRKSPDNTKDLDDSQVRVMGEVRIA